MAKIVTRVVGHKDLLALRKFYNTYGDELLKSGPLTDHDLDDAAIQRLHNPQLTRRVVVEENGKIIAAAQVCGRQTERRFIGTVEYVLVARAWRGHGFGPMVMEELERQALDMGITKLELHSELEHKAAHQMYHNLGYLLVEDSLVHFEKKIAPPSAKDREPIF